MTDAFVLGGTRTPFARYGGSLSHLRLDDLLGMTIRGACERVGVPLQQVEDITAGCVNVAHEGMGDVARWAALAAGFPDSVAAALRPHRQAKLTQSNPRPSGTRGKQLGYPLSWPC